MGYEIIPEIENFKKYADQNVLQLNHGGIVAYVHKTLISHVFDVQYEDMLSILPTGLCANVHFHRSVYPA